MKSSNNWYIAKLVFEIKSSDHHTAQFDEQWRMIEASSLANAKIIADALGAEETQYIHQYNGAKLKWEYLAVVDLYLFDNSTHGSQVYSRTEVTDRADLYQQSVSSLAENLEARISKEKSILA